MKYNFYINQVKALEWWLSFSECCLIDLFSHLPKWADVEIIDWEVWYFFSKNKILDEAPLLSKWWKINTIYKQLKRLIDQELVNYKKVWVKDYWQITQKIKEWDFIENQNSEKNPSELGKKSESSSEKNPTYNNTRIYNNTSNTNIGEIEISPPIKKDFKELMKEKIDFSNIPNLSSDIIKKEAMNFFLYWTEKNENWKKERWEMQKTFDVSRRFHKWLDNAWKFNKPSKSYNITTI